jgi:thiol-disulfide isomerase/thioredoxin
MQLTRFQKLAVALGIIVLSLGFAASQLAKFAVDASLADWQQGFAGYVATGRLQVASGKPMVVLFYTDWCPNCKKLREEVLASPEVRRYVETLHPVRINPELGLAEQKLADSYGVRGYPSLYVVDAKTGNAVMIRRTSNITPAQLIEQLVQAQIRHDA